MKDVMEARCAMGAVKGKKQSKDQKSNGEKLA